MSEWLKEHAWKLTLAALSNAHRHAPTHSPSTTSRNNDVHRSVPVNHGVCPGFQKVSDTVLTQNAVTLSEISANVHRYALQCDVDESCTAVSETAIDHLGETDEPVDTQTLRFDQRTPHVINEYANPPGC